MRKLLLVLHALAIALACGYYALAVVVHDTPDANIGAGLAMMLIGLLGLPWSWLVFDIHRNTWDDLQVLFPLAALLNLGLHWIAGAWFARWQSRRV